MSFFQNKNERLALLTTVLTVFFLFLSVLFLGLPQKETQHQYGVMVAFGNMDFGSGDIAQIPNPPQKNTPSETLPPATTAPQKINEQIVTTEKSEITVSPEKKKKTKLRKKNNPKLKKKNTAQKIKKTPQKKKLIPMKKPSKATQNLLNNLLNHNSQKVGSGDDDKAGVKGEINGEKRGHDYMEVVGNGGKRYRLSGRKVLSRPIFKPNCNEEGRVCVKIKVGINGRVIKATPVVKGTTNMATCLLEAAKKSALQTLWNADQKAPRQQIGLIVYDFILAQ